MYAHLYDSMILPQQPIDIPYLLIHLHLWIHLF